MNMARLPVVLAGLALLGLSTNTHAVLCTFGSPGGEPTLQTSFNNLLGAAGAPDVGSTCLSDDSDSVWVTNGTAAVTIIIELAGFANQNILGIYDSTDPSRRVTIFDGGDAMGSSASISFSLRPNGNYRVTVSGASSGTKMFQSDLFGFYLATPEGNTFYSDSSLNSPYAHPDHMYAYQGAGAVFQSGPLAGQTFGPNRFLLAWEDLRGDNGGYDGDFQDMIVLAESILPIPLPAGFILLLSALAGLLPLVSSRRDAAIAMMPA